MQEEQFSGRPRAYVINICSQPCLALQAGNSYNALNIVCDFLCINTFTANILHYIPEKVNKNNMHVFTSQNLGKKVGNIMKPKAVFYVGQHILENSEKYC